MPRKIALTLVFGYGIFLLAFAQDEKITKQPTVWRIEPFGIKAGPEMSLSRTGNWSLNLQAGTSVGWILTGPSSRSDDNRRTFANGGRAWFWPMVQGDVRHYYNFARREAKGKPTRHFSGNYVAAGLRYTMDPYYLGRNSLTSTNDVNGIPILTSSSGTYWDFRTMQHTLSLNVGWGMQRNNKWGGYYNLFLGVSGSVINRPLVQYNYQTTAGTFLYSNEGYTTLGFSPVFRLDWGIGFSRKK